MLNPLGLLRFQMTKYEESAPPPATSEIKHHLSPLPTFYSLHPYFIESRLDFPEFRSCAYDEK